VHDITQYTYLLLLYFKEKKRYLTETQKTEDESSVERHSYEVIFFDRVTFERQTRQQIICHGWRVSVRLQPAGCSVYSRSTYANCRSCCSKLHWTKWVAAAARASWHRLHLSLCLVAHCACHHCGCCCCCIALGLPGSEHGITAPPPPCRHWSVVLIEQVPAIN